MKEETQERARELATAAPEVDPAADGFRETAVFLTPTEIVFLVEGPDVGKIVHDLLDPVRSTAISPWIPLFDGPLRWAQEV